ncbi:MAG: anti-sigma factor [Pseudonocardia sp.]|nr:anti-sigma factor [Pseudonocardia sp.]
MTEQIVGWALHSLEPEEEMAAVEHLGSCADCRQTAADVAEVATDLGASVEQCDPPKRLRASIVELAEQTPQEHPATAGAEPARAQADDGDAEARPRRAPQHRRSARDDPSGRTARPGSSRRRGRMLVAAVAVVAVLAGGGAVIGYAQQMRSERDASLAQAQTMFDMMAQMDRPGATHAFLSPDTPNAEPVAAVMNSGGQRSVISVGLTPNSVEDQTYVLWGLNGNDAPQPIGTFDVQPTRESPISVRSAAGGSFGTYAISLEPGRQAPTTPTDIRAKGQVET